MREKNTQDSVELYQKNFGPVILPFPDLLDNIPVEYME